jgi:hypothetical protein
VNEVFDVIVIGGGQARFVDTHTFALADGHRLRSGMTRNAVRNGWRTVAR